MSEANDFNKFKEVCISYMRDYLHDLGYSYDKAPSVYQGKALTAFYVNEILAELKNLDDQTVEEGLSLDKAGDMGVDFVHKSERTHNIYQSKYRSWSGGNSLTSADVLNFFDTHRKITNKDELQSRANAEVKAYFSEAKKSDQYVYYLISNKAVSEAVRKDFSAHRDKFKKEYHGQADWQLCDADVLIKDWVRARTQLESIPGEVPINFDKKNNTAALFEVSAFMEDDQIESVLCLVKGT